MKFKRGFVILFLILLSINFISAIRITPARIEGAFKPGLETSVEYYVSSPGGKNIEVYVDGALKDYITLDKEKIIGGSGSFIATVKFPDDLELEPGPHKTYIGAREEIDRELASFFAVQAVIQSLIKFNVPYPGKYVESHLSTENVNEDEPIVFELEMIGRGDEDVLTRPRIEIFSETGDLIEILEFKDRELASQQRIKLKKEWDTTGHSAGRYSAVSIIDYGGETPSEDMIEFRIGELTLDLVNYTKEVIIQGTTGFELVIESGWNDKIDGAYADVKFFNNTSPYNLITSFKTTPTDLEPWGKQGIVGYFNSSLFSSGTYEADVEIIYYGKEVGKTKRETIFVKFAHPGEKEPNYIIWGSVIIGLSLLIIAVLFLLFKDGKRKRK